MDTQPVRLQAGFPAIITLLLLTLSTVACPAVEHAENQITDTARGREMIKTLAEAGHHPELRFVEYPNVSHDSWTRTYARDDIYQWLFAQRKR